ncbi:hypothetical protein [Uliginosibacterium gangwonense]|uniref:hypothetical protein n=1 Tax=Uliginosibacterium gangwonense TaxID=392736 RepID=UPI000378279D|nr:hypothetical protein [Uliginosibacterium gangwonense]
MTAAVKGCWRDGKILVIARESALPHRCIKCNAPVAEGTKVRNVYWHHPALYLLILLQVLIYALVAVLVRKKARITFSLCAEHRGKYWKGLAVGWIGTLAGIGVTIHGVTGDQVWTTVEGSVLLLVSVVIGIGWTRLLSPQRIDEDYVRLRGCGRAFLDSLPDYSR